MLRRRRVSPGAVLWLVGVWLLLWGSISPLAIGSGLVIALVLLVGTPQPSVEIGLRFRPLRVLMAEHAAFTQGSDTFGVQIKVFFQHLLRVFPKSWRTRGSRAGPRREVNRLPRQTQCAAVGAPRFDQKSTLTRLPAFQRLADILDRRDRNADVAQPRVDLRNAMEFGP